MADYIEMRRSSAPLDCPHASVLIPVDANDEAVLSKIPFGDVAIFQMVRERSLPQHKLFRAILKRVGEASAYETDDQLLLYLKIRLGWCDRMLLPSGEIVTVPRSTSFPKMTQDEFQRLFDDSMRVIFEEIIPGTNRDDLIQEIQRML